MKLALDSLWNTSEAAECSAGVAELVLTPARIELSWTLGLPLPARIPEASIGFTDGLWEWDVIELFLASPGSTRYLELEIGPGGHWLALGFADVRRRDRELRELEPLIEQTQSGPTWSGRTIVPLSGVERYAGSGPWSGVVVAVLGEPVAGHIHLSSAALPGSRPDFHQPASWPPIS